LPASNTMVQCVVWNGAPPSCKVPGTGFVAANYLNQDDFTTQIGAVPPPDLFGGEQTRSPGLIQSVAVAMISLFHWRSGNKPVDD
jgi:hypothetical protein